MTQRPFHGARLKVKRANHHIADIEVALERFREKYQHPITVEPDNQPGKRYMHIVVARPDIEAFALMAGDAIHNLRSALDHAAWELMKRYGGDYKMCAFPTGKDRSAFESACGRVPTPRCDAGPVLVGFEAYPGGKGEILNVLTLADNADKHRLIVDLEKSATIPMVKGRNPDGSGIVETETFVAGSEQRFFEGPFHTQRDTKIAHDILIVIAEGTPGEPILPTLANFVKAVDGAIEVLDRFVAANP